MCVGVGVGACACVCVRALGLTRCCRSTAGDWRREGSRHPTASLPCAATAGSHRGRTLQESSDHSVADCWPRRRHHCGRQPPRLALRLPRAQPKRGYTKLCEEDWISRPSSASGCPSPAGMAQLRCDRSEGSVSTLRTYHPGASSTRLLVSGFAAAPPTAQDGAVNTGAPMATASTFLH